jgi:hypothetical protein
MATNCCVRTLTGHSGTVRSISFFPTDSKFLASAGYDDTVRIWDVANGNCIEVFLSDDEIFKVEFSPDGKNLLIDDELHCMDSEMLNERKEEYENLMKWTVDELKKLLNYRHIMYDCDCSSKSVLIDHFIKEVDQENRKKSIVDSEELERLLAEIPKSFPLSL